MACPFFMPIEKLENGSWLHAGRLPLGCGWSGHCTAPGYEGETPSQEELQEFCNLGYAERCSRLPQERLWDSVRFSAKTVAARNDLVAERIHVRYVCERKHLPAAHGVLEFDTVQATWADPHPDSRVQRMAECFVASYVEKRKPQEISEAAS
jgi:hypothetical protein